MTGIIVSETMFGGITDGIWASKNKGKTYDTIDWSVFAEDDDDEEEEVRRERSERLRGWGEGGIRSSL